MIMTTNASISGWPDFDFRSLPLDPLSRKQLAGIYDHVRCRGSVPPHRSKLLTGVIFPAIFVPERGLYLPASDNIYLLRKLRVYCERFEASFATFPCRPVAVAFFSNALLIPPGYGTSSFDHHDAAMPALRVTNAGFMPSPLVMVHAGDARGIGSARPAAGSGAPGRRRATLLVHLICLRCNRANAADSKFCSECGAGLLRKFCNECHAVNDAESHFCQSCGAVLPAPPSVSPAPSAPPPGEVPDLTDVAYLEPDEPRHLVSAPVQFYSGPIVAVSPQMPTLPAETVSRVVKAHISVVAHRSC